MTIVATPRTVAAAVTTNTTATAGKHLPADATAGPITVTLPAVSTSNAGAHLSVEKRDSTTNLVTISGSIRGAAGTVNLVWQSETVEFTADASGSWWPVAGHKTKAALDANYIAHVPPSTGNATQDTAMLQAALNAVATGGTVRLADSTTYLLNATLTCSKHINIVGGGVTTNYGSATATGSSYPGYAPELLGTILQCTVAGIDALQMLGSGQSVNLQGFGVLFQDGLASTGHGITAAPLNNVVAPGHDQGIVDSLWSNVSVYGHDGNHYGFYLLNPQYVTTINLRGYGGGGILTEADHGKINAGNIVHIHPFFHVKNTGTAHGIAHKASDSGGEPGILNFCVYHRPQVSLSVTTSTQRPWHDLVGPGVPTAIQMYNPDFEGLAAFQNSPVIGSGTGSFGDGIVDYGESILSVRIGRGAAGNATASGQNVAIGTNALATATTDTNVAIGREALMSGATPTNNVAIGQGAGRHITGNGTVAIGQNAMSAGAGTGGSNVAVGYNAMNGVTTGAANECLGQDSFVNLTTGSRNIGIGKSVGYFTNGSANNALTTGNDNIMLGDGAGFQSATNRNNTVSIGTNAGVDGNNTVAIGYGTKAKAGGAVAIGIDSSGNPAQTSTGNEFMLGTANHLVNIPGRLTLAQRTPTSSSDSQGRVGDIASDDNYVYAKTSTGWKRTALTTF